MSNANKLRDLLKREEPVLAPGAYDAISAKLIQQVGFEAVYMTGFGVSASLLGKPDLGLITLHEMAQQASNICKSINLPLIADADNGYGNELNIARTIELYEQAGVSAIQLEDQIMPKKCGHMENKQVVPFEEAVKKIRAASRARSNPDTLIIARTDARAINGKEDAIYRLKAFSDEGADILFFEAPQSREEIEWVARELEGKTLMLNMVEFGKSPLLSKEEIKELGYRLIIWPITALFSGVKAMETALQSLKTFGKTKDTDHMYSFHEFTRFIGLPSHLETSRNLTEEK